MNNDNNSRYIVKIFARDSKLFKDDEMMCTTYLAAGGKMYHANWRPDDDASDMYEHAFKTYEGAQIGCKRTMGLCFVPGNIPEHRAFMMHLKKHSRKEKDDHAFKMYEKIKDRYDISIISPEEALKDWTRMHNNFKKMRKLGQ